MKQKAVDGARLERVAYSPAEVAAACGLSRKAITIKIGELRAAKVCSGRRLLITVEALRAWIDRKRAARPRALQSGTRLKIVVSPVLESGPHHPPWVGTRVGTNCVLARPLLATRGTLRSGGCAGNSGWEQAYRS
jgi:hypothetical protein